MVKKWLAIFAVAGMVLAGCGEEGGGESGGGSDDNGGGQTSAPDEITEDNFADRVLAAQQEAGSMELASEMVIEGQSITMNGSVLSGDTLESTLMEMTMEVPGEGTMEMRMVDGIMYMQIPDMGWMSMDLAEAAEGMGMDANQFDPAAQTEAFEEAMISLEPSGEVEEIDGVETQPYTLVLDADQLNEVEGMEGQAPPQGEMEVQMWIGPDDLPRRMVMDVEGEQVSFDMFNWGTDVNVEAPPEDEIIDMGDMSGDAPGSDAVG